MEIYDGRIHMATIGDGLVRLMILRPFTQQTEQSDNHVAPCPHFTPRSLTWKWILQMIDLLLNVIKTWALIFLW